MPSAGGGSVRTHAINKRLVAMGHSVTVLTTAYPDAIERWQDGVHYIPVGFGRGRTKLSRLLGYVLRLPWEVRRRRDDCDLVVEDFFAPFSTMSAPLWTNRPTIGMVQWLDGREKARQYGLPFHIVERIGVRTHSRLVAVSHGTAEALRQLNGRAHIEVIGNGLDTRALEIRPQLGRNVVFIGRLDVPDKGIDFLMDAWERAYQQVDGDLLIIGAGPDENLVREMVENKGLQARVRFVGWVDGTRKFQLLGEARLVVVPSRKESFGLVAIESLATGTPVIAFNIPGLREVVPTGSGWLVEPFDTAALAAEIALRYNSSEDLTVAGREGRQSVAQYDWDVAAAQQAAAYQRALGPFPADRRKNRP
ncbi:glycosyltransferase family 4 protein [Kocuria turfanensis]|uniref:glycosyltransferase family 4 protein n=1 Tax=Kocuria turfanensis TaxID=388357 RepID=UPI0040356E5F